MSDDKKHVDEKLNKDLSSKKETEEEIIDKAVNRIYNFSPLFYTAYAMNSKQQNPYIDYGEVAFAPGITGARRGVPEVLDYISAAIKASFEILYRESGDTINKKILLNNREKIVKEVYRKFIENQIGMVQIFLNEI